MEINTEYDPFRLEAAEETTEIEEVMKFVALVFFRFSVCFPSFIRFVYCLYLSASLVIPDWRIRHLKSSTLTTVASLTKPNFNTSRSFLGFTLTPVCICGL